LLPDADPGSGQDLGMLYVDDGNDAVLDAGLGYVSNLIALSALGLEIVILRKKIFDL
jgi:hypothetical protein